MRANSTGMSSRLHWAPRSLRETSGLFTWVPVSLLGLFGFLVLVLFVLGWCALSTNAWGFLSLSFSCRRCEWALAWPVFFIFSKALLETRGKRKANWISKKSQTKKKIKITQKKNPTKKHSKKKFYHVFFKFECNGWFSW